jgi:enamine deaminase RidA (YjgF/YER057c/UK114 family)
LNVFLTDLTNFATLNQVMAEYFNEPYPARAAIQVAALPRGAVVEMDCVVELDA